MNIAEMILNIMELARRSNMTFGEMLEWLSKNDKNNLPWEE